MTKFKTFRHGKHMFRTYCKEVGHGWEVGMTFQKKTVFVGNFIHRTEALSWFNTMNRDYVQFAKKYWMVNQTPKSWYVGFLRHHLYNKYYGFLDKLLMKHNRTFKRAFVRDTKTYHRLSRRWDKQERFYLRAA